MVGSARIAVYVDSDLKPLIPGFLENRRSDALLMSEAVVKGDFEAVRILGHSMKGVGGGYGFDEITRLGLMLEQAAKAQDSLQIKGAINLLSEYLDQVDVYYRDSV